jgi:hypothetical protein
MTIKRLSLDRRVDLIMAFYRDAANRKFQTREDIEEGITLLRHEIRRQIENAIRDDREMREGFIEVIKETIRAIEANVTELANAGTQIELTNEELCPSCGVPAKLHGTVHTGAKWVAFVCAGITGSKIFISPDAAARIVDVLQETDNERQPGPGDAGDTGTGRDAGDSSVSLSGE